ncbi:hypothetical protein WN51_11551 [Melipona quadrifasciata]|uniref:Uncharacterized protein n=1 Tax=Melipona quadrifasciata TaxID=166423 RepID=A0A0M9A9G8_9HYME|nr:hypothetical protein WN51_11551 [Melipona quadrifasciata]
MTAINCSHRGEERGQGSWCRVELGLTGEMGLVVPGQRHPRSAFPIHPANKSPAASRSGCLHLNNTLADTSFFHECVPRDKWTTETWTTEQSRVLKGLEDLGEHYLLEHTGFYLYDHVSKGGMRVVNEADHTLVISVFNGIPWLQLVECLTLRHISRNRIGEDFFVLNQTLDALVRDEDEITLESQPLAVKKIRITQTRFGPANSGPVLGADSERRLEREEEETSVCKCLAHLPHGEPIIEARYSDSAQCYPIVDPVATQLTGSPMVGDRGVVGGARTLYP